jgi:DNA-binding LacI/PurR family transcriptional regulator
MRNTISDVARGAGVSPSTVSRVFNRPELVKEETRVLVMEIANEMQFVPNRMARGLITGQTGLVALIVQDISNPYFGILANGCEEELRKNNIAVALFSTSESQSAEEHYRRMLAERSVDGFIFISSPADSKSLGDHDTPIPTVYVHRRPDGPHIDAVYTDDRRGAMLAAEHLVKLGHERIAVVTGQLETITGETRLRAFRDTLVQHGIGLPDQYILTGDFKMEGGRRAGKQLLRCDPRPTGVFVASDFMAYALIHALAEDGVQVPGEVSVVGFDDLPMSDLFFPRLTTVKSPIRGIGETAARLLLRRLEDSSLPGEVVVLPVELVERDSTRVWP